MNHATEIELKKIVERAVRPVPAGIDRKKQMRAELLAHVHSAFEEELARDADEQTALRQTRARFGDPAKLAAELRATLSRGDRFVFLVDRLAGRQPGESAWRCSIRRATYLFAATEAMFVLVLPFFLIQSQPLQVWRGAYLVLCLATAVSTAMFAGSLLTIGLRATLFHRQGGRFARLIGICFLAMILVPLCEFGLFAAVSGDIRSSMWSARIALPFTVLLPIGLSFLAWAIEREERYRSGWADLTLE